MENLIEYVPGGTCKIKYLPFRSVAAPSGVPSTITFAPIKGSPVSLLVTVPEILPVVPPKSNWSVKIRASTILALCFLMDITKNIYSKFTSYLTKISFFTE